MRCSRSGRPRLRASTARRVTAKTMLACGHLAWPLARRITWCRAAKCPPQNAGRRPRRRPGRLKLRGHGASFTSKRMTDLGRTSGLGRSPPRHSAGSCRPEPVEGRKGEPPRLRSPRPIYYLPLALALVPALAPAPSHTRSSAAPIRPPLLFIRGSALPSVGHLFAPSRQAALLDDDRPSRHTVLGLVCTPRRFLAELFLCLLDCRRLVIQEMAS